MLNTNFSDWQQDLITTNLLVIGRSCALTESTEYVDDTQTDTKISL
jgi:hypothetical protein